MQEINEYHKKSGIRLKKIREIFNEGRKFSAEQFAHILNETRDRIANYESGRSQIPIRLLYELYIRGINPNFIITGEGDIFANTKEGARFKRFLIAKTKIDPEAEINYNELLKELDTKIDDDDSETFRAAAGNINSKK